MKKLLINGCFDKLISLSRNYTQYLRKESVLSTSSITDSITNETASSITDGNEAVSEPVEDTAKTVQS
jgi:type II secretory pathway component PulJ